MQDYGAHDPVYISGSIIYDLSVSQRHMQVLKYSLYEHDPLSIQTLLHIPFPPDLASLRVPSHSCWKIGVES